MENLNSRNRNTQALRGYTLAELLVAIAVFLVIVGIAVGGFTSGLRTHRQAVALMAANGNASIVLEQMAREIRTSSNFDVSGAPPCLPSPSLCFDNADGQYVEYAYDSTARAITRGGFAPTSRITDDNVIVEYLRFNYRNVVNYPPRIIINVGVRPNVPGADAAVIHLQTAVSGRNF